MSRRPACALLVRGSRPVWHTVPPDAAVVLRAVDADEDAVRQHRPARPLGATVEALGVARARTERVQLRVDLLVDQACRVLHSLGLTLGLLLEVLALHGQEVRHGSFSWVCVGSRGCVLACYLER